MKIPRRIRLSLHIDTIVHMPKRLHPDDEAHFIRAGLEQQFTGDQPTAAEVAASEDWWRALFLLQMKFQQALSQSPDDLAALLRYHLLCLFRLDDHPDLGASIEDVRCAPIGCGASEWDLAHLCAGVTIDDVITYFLDRVHVDVAGSPTIAIASSD